MQGLLGLPSRPSYGLWFFTANGRPLESSDKGSDNIYLHFYGIHPHCCVESKLLVESGQEQGGRWKAVAVIRVRCGTGLDQGGGNSVILRV